MTTPDRWVVLKIFSSSDGTFYKVLGSWYGGYLYGNSWRMNSGIQRVEKTEDAFLFYGFSGSCYECRINDYGMHLESSGVVNQMQKERKNLGGMGVIFKPQPTYGIRVWMIFKL
jgi:hypothetical protein